MCTRIHHVYRAVPCSQCRHRKKSERKKESGIILWGLRKALLLGPSTHTHAWLQQTYIPRTKKKFDRFTHSLRKGEGARNRGKGKWRNEFHGWAQFRIAYGVWLVGEGERHGVNTHHRCVPRLQNEGDASASAWQWTPAQEASLSHHTSPKPGSPGPVGIAHVVAGHPGPAHGVAVLVLVLVLVLVAVPDV